LKPEAVYIFRRIEDVFTFQWRCCWLDGAIGIGLISLAKLLPIDTN
jgi:hypothetical protein